MPELRRDDGVVIRVLETVADLRSCEGIQKEVWAFDDTEVLGATHLKATVEAGGLVAAAAVAGETVGFVCGFPAWRPDWFPGPGLHSHMLAVLPRQRGRGLGKELKLFQRAWARERGYRWVTWTFDPLQAGNARLNLEHLGAEASRYLVDAYGRLGGKLNAELPTDRLLAYWDLGEAVAEPCGKTPPGEAPVRHRTAAVLSSDGRGGAGKVNLDADQDRLRLAVPANLNALLQEDPDRALAWRLAVREAFVHYFARGYRARGFRDGAYILHAPESKDLEKRNF